ncbi:MAG: hypothetical protein WC969_02765 [Elusimicrobiota bacterium]
MPRKGEAKTLAEAASAWALARDLVFAPARALRALHEDPEALWSAARVYAAYLAFSTVFYALKPAGFPPLGPEQPFTPPEGGLLFWAQVQAWSPPLTALLCALTAFFLTLLAGRRLAPRLLAACASAAAPLALLLIYRNTGMPRWALGAGLLALAALIGRRLRATDPSLWRPLAGWLLLVNALNLALMPLFAAAVLLRAALLYNGLEIALLFATLGWGTYGVARIARLPNARAFCALFLAMLSQIVLVFAFHYLGALPRTVLKALMSV